MRSRDDRTAANQRAMDALYQAKLKAITDCDRQIIPEPVVADRAYHQDDELTAFEVWDRLSVDYLKNEWPPSMLC